ncbi:conserved Plasmodium protein, unknown function [Plasmodium knowlesi strain H]|uniref:Uncharacterized protein n=3 Tax=Plasmodium knowlesi TaxID=5850 RepID=A0A5K1V780_PLAKH|nr:conserved Plasmodium protein, unknown function [Plasmodium knowlesi strain H]OTN64324.1 Uncharacterized protein PKNOH_S130168200 [Plasmodium knowlesi]CAA9988850.1 conserved Plasmodium protein, unknown function [Plasmodium knowlesi strain H]SBO24678.1 conserved Plasmodium protein, unknown function [Plasmodium knowlesi strain H]SBO27959.1 conserved Plasmodium protein, unknown function [Plasmodium knowlesi strain H]VVS78324.1 conserved Plasmodium protein, unknown function [Plasmodium knowlesi |eukprot:XP_002261196.1 hypothetical protein, conserved in Plasmodium species [Plasmodium knowlesi strain H]
MNEEEKVFFKFTESKILLSEFCEEYVKAKKKEEILTQELNKVQLKNCQLENEIEKYKELVSNIERKKDKEMENYNFEYDIKIKKLETEMDVLNSCLSKEKENYNLKATELIGLKLENEKYKAQLRDRKENNHQEKENIKMLSQNNINVLNKMYADINQKVEAIMQHLHDSKNNRHDIEEKIKTYQSLLNEYLKKITDTNLKYQQFYKLHKEAHFKNMLNKSKKKVLKSRIEELINQNQVLSNQVDALKKNIDHMDAEKTQYFLLLKKAEKKKLFFYHKFKEKNATQGTDNAMPQHQLDYPRRDGPRRSHSYDTSRRSPPHVNIEDQVLSDQRTCKNGKTNSPRYGNNALLKNDTLPWKQDSKRKNRSTSIYKYRDVNRNKSYRADEFNIKKERKRKKILFFSDNDHDKKQKRKNEISNEKSTVQYIDLIVNSKNLISNKMGSHGTPPKTALC